MFNLGSSLIVFTAACTAWAMAAYLPGVRRGPGRPRLKQARLAVYLAGAGLVLASAHMWQLILSHQFQYDYVYRYSSRDLPLKYLISAFWGGQEGTFLLWALFGGMLAVFLRFKAKHYEAPVQFFYLGINLFLLLIMIKKSPFSTLPQTPPDGAGLNPLLQDPWMVIHPPVTFFGFAALGIPAAYAMAAMIKEDWDNWIKASLPWTSFGVLSLGAGLVLGGYWAYSILGWGGFWGWDPVENSSLVPWVMATVLLHNQLIQLKKGSFRRMNLILALVPFLLLTYSTFLTRSGILADFSVHSFTDLGINQFLVLFMTAFTGGGLLLYFWKQGKAPSTKETSNFWSREVMTFLGGLALTLFGLTVLLGTSAPLITRIGGTPSSVQPEFYNRVVLPFGILFALFMALAPQYLWKYMAGKDLLRRLRWPLVGTVVFIPIAFVAGLKNPAHLALAALSALALLSNIVVLWTMVRINPQTVGGPLTHAGVALCILGIMISTAYTRKEVVVLPRGEKVAFLDYHLEYSGHRPVEDGTKTAYDVTVHSQDSQYTVSPTMFFSEMNNGMMKKPAIKSFFTHDVYVSPVRVASQSLEERLRSEITLEPEVPVDSHGMVFLLHGFIPRAVPDDGHGHAAEDMVGDISVVVNDVAHSLKPVLRRHPNGGLEMFPEEIPGTGHAISLVKTDMATGSVILGLQPVPVTIKKEATAKVFGYPVRFSGFEVAMGQGADSRGIVYAKVQVETESGSISLKPGISIQADNSRALIEAPLGESGLNLVLSGFNADAGEGYFQVARPSQEFLLVEASYKPFIMLLWIGTLVSMVGLILATVYRGRLAVTTGFKFTRGNGKKARKSQPKRGKRQVAA